MTMTRFKPGDPIRFSDAYLASLKAIDGRMLERYKRWRGRVVKDWGNGEISVEWGIGPSGVHLTESFEHANKNNL